MRFSTIVAVLLVFVSVSSSFVVTSAASLAPPKEKIQTELVIMILSHDKDGRRNSLRETWLRDETPNVTQWVFLIGNIDKSSVREQVLKEQAQYNDIIIMDDVVDDYEHLSDKVLKGFKAIHERFEFDYLLKSDTDTFVNIPTLLKYLRVKEPTARYIGTFAHTQDNNEIHGHLKGIYYMLGGGYLLSSDLVQYFAQSQQFMKRSRSEDVTVGIHLHSLYINMDAEPDSIIKAGAASTCSCEQTVMINHKCSKSDMYYMYYALKENRQVCEWKTDSAYAQHLRDAYKIPIDGNHKDESLVMRW